MAKFFLSGRYRPNIWPFWALMAIEFCLTVGLLALVGIAAPNLYRTKLWADGAANGFNSSPLAGLYAAANYRPYKAPKVWSQFITNFNVVIVVLSMFLMLCKSIMYMLHVFPPIISVFVHLIVLILYAVSVSIQTSSDLSDPNHPQHGAPWYITKSCSVTHFQSNVGYCQQAKATFWCMVVMLVVMVAYVGFSAFSCFPSKEQRVEYEEKQRIKKEKYGFLDSPEDDVNNAINMKSTEATSYPAGRDIGAMNPMTPRTLAFNKLGGTKDLPLRITTPKTMSFSLRSPGLPRTPGNQGKFPEVKEEEVEGNGKNPMYFPPPPKVSSK